MSWRRTVSTGVQHGIPMPCFTTALSFYDGYRHEKLPANLLQVRQREALVINTGESVCVGFKGFTDDQISIVQSEICVL